MSQIEVPEVPMATEQTAPVEVPAATKKRPASTDLLAERSQKRRDIDTDNDHSASAAAAVATVPLADDAGASASVTAAVDMEDDPEVQSASNGDGDDTSSSSGDSTTQSQSQSNGHSSPHTNSQQASRVEGSSSVNHAASSERLVVFDTTLRDGEQSPYVFLSRDQKLEILRGMVRLGVDVCEIGFPANSADLSTIRTLIESIKDYAPEERPQKDPISLCVLARCVKSDIDLAWDVVQHAKRPRIHVFYGTSDIHLKYKLNKTEDQALEVIRKHVAYAKSKCADIEFSAEDACRTNIDFLVKVCTVAIEAGATTINCPDTVGFRLPQQIGAMFAELIKRVPNSNKVVWSTHNHDDLGLATANTLAGIAAGCRQIEGTINGIGERAGNTAIEEVVMAVHTHRHAFSVDHSINTKLFVETSELVEKYSGMRVQRNKAVVGKNAFLHEAGVHVSAFLKKRDSYEIISPELVGRDPNRCVVLGKSSGRAGYRQVMESNKVKFTGAEHFDASFARFRELFSDNTKNESDISFEQILETTKVRPSISRESSP